MPPFEHAFNQLYRAR